MNKIKLKKMIRHIIKEETGTNKFGKLGVNDYSEIVPKHKKLLQQILSKNNGGNLIGVAPSKSKTKSIIIIGDNGLVYINLDTLLPFAVAKINK